MESNRSQEVQPPPAGQRARETGFFLSGWTEKPHWPALAALLALWAVHVIATWRESTVFSGDYGSWMHQMERFAHGEVLYRDFQWLYPPMAMWIIGSVARIFGAQLIVFRIVTIILSLLVFLGYFFYVSRLLPRRLVLGAVVAGFLLATGYAQTQSAPITLGMYTPAAPLGFLFLLSAILLQFRQWRSWSWRDATLVGFFCGLCILTKQDFWLPAVYLVAAGFLTGAQTNQPGRVLARLCSPTAFLLTVVAGSLLVVSSAGWGKLIGIPTGFGWVAQFQGREFPSWERLTVEITALAAFVVAHLVCLSLTRAISPRDGARWVLGGILLLLLGGAVHISMSYRIGLHMQAEGAPQLASPTEAFLHSHVGSNRELLVRSFVWLKKRAQLHFLPALLPALAALLLLSRWNRIGSVAEGRTILFLLGLCLAARLRRSFEGVDWFQILLEIPVYLLCVQLLLPERRAQLHKGLQLFLACLALVGAYALWSFGIGMFTLEGRGQLIETPKGFVRLHGPQADFYRELKNKLDLLDPGGTRPLFVMGYTGGVDYFLNRRNPSPVTVGFSFSGFPAEVLSGIRKQSPLLLDNPFLSRARAAEPAPQLNVFGWELKMQESPYFTVDHPLFERLRAGCEEKARIKRGQDVFTLYDCK